MSIIDAVSNAASPKRRLNIVKNPLAENLVKEWHPTKNVDMEAHNLSAGSNRKVWWLGECGHEWEAKVFDRSQGRGCSYCSGKYILRGFNDLLTLKPLVSSQFHPTKNGNLNVEDLMVGSNKKVWWLNPVCGHEWEMKVSNRNEHVPCSVCDGFIVQAGINDISTTHPEIAKYLHPTKNVGVDTSRLTSFSNKKVWWLGACGHEWQSIIANISKRGVSCVYCSGKYVLKGFNDIATVKPSMISEWHPTKNIPLFPTDLTVGSRKKVWWQCLQGHEWQTPVYSRAKENGHNCPYCTGRNVIFGVTDLLSVNPTLASEWHPTKNSPLTPSEVKAGTNQRVWWQCKKGHEWQSQVNWRNNGNGCSICSANLFVSKAEQEIADFVMAQGLNIKQSDRLTLKGMELDIYVPSKNFAIEYNGLYWHNDFNISDTRYHYKKWHKAKENGIQLIQIWEDDWNKNPEQIKMMILHKLGLSIQDNIFARKTSVVTLTEEKVKVFFNKNHVQGHANASIYLGLEEKANGEIVAALSLQKEPGNSFNIIRYATNKNVVGGFTKLLKNVESQFSPKKFVAFSDHCVSSGNLFFISGFTATKIFTPDYQYVVKGKRKHKDDYGVNRFREDPNLTWEEGLTEKELSVLNGIPRIWDAGKTKWVKQLVK